MSPGIELVGGPHDGLVVRPHAFAPWVVVPSLDAATCEIRLARYRYEPYAGRAFYAGDSL